MTAPTPVSASAPPRIALIHALPHSVEPINAAFEAQWPDALRMNLLDDSLSADLARSGAGLDAAMHDRFLRLADYAVGTGAQALLFTCSAFGPCIEAVGRRHAGLPVLKPNEAMVDDIAQAAGPGAGEGPVGLIATFAPTLASMPPEFPAHVALRTALADGALDALNRGDAALHDRLIAEQARTLQAQGCRRIALAQFSMARARGACEAATGLPVFTTVHSAVARLRQRLG
ncbi:aspartate/glutamate racemase family protein [Acidovorax sp. NCPPB 3576]|uniref:aspartate/glutamate racemase family protein n=1 Tax=Acidovorax sp. NCPPB 3576 TaxID=2940488 RepID=UPI00234AA460|nr:aspartate/glutamate racemase family protein [Acidovorax sp. NCPPB 3576]WCM88563.1 aspartate/glutamate racemase family protein [Acidovorax sp. NCPPB 3576]